MPGMTEVDRAVARIRAFVASRKGLSKSGLAKRAKLSLNALRDLDHADWNPKAETLDVLLKTIAEIKAIEKAKRKTRPRGGTERAAA